MTNYLFKRDNSDLAKVAIIEMHQLCGNIRFTAMGNDSAAICCERPLSAAAELCFLLKWSGQLKPYTHVMPCDYDSTFWEAEQRQDGTRWRRTSTGDWVKAYPIDS